MTSKKHAPQGRGEKLLKAFLAKDAETVSYIFSGLITSMGCQRHPIEEPFFYPVVMTLLTTFDFKIISDLNEPPNRFGCCLELPGSIHLLIELKYCRRKKKLTQKEIERVLADEAKFNLLPKEIDESLADIAMTKLNAQDVGCASSLPEGPERTRLLADLALTVLPESDINQALAAKARLKLSEDEIEQALSNAADKPLSDEQIDSLLSDVAQSALSGITYKNYPGVRRNQAEEFIKLALAFYENGKIIKAAFD
jgi:hypothetical protein